MEAKRRAANKRERNKRLVSTQYKWRRPLDEPIVKPKDWDPNVKYELITLEDKPYEPKEVECFGRVKNLQEQFTRKVLARVNPAALAMREGLIPYVEPKPLPNRQRVNMRRFNRLQA
jgi:hypothetical protein